MLHIPITGSFKLKLKILLENRMITGCLFFILRCFTFPSIPCFHGVFRRLGCVCRPADKTNRFLYMCIILRLNNFDRDISWRLRQSFLISLEPSLWFEDIQKRNLRRKCMGA